MLMDKNVKVKCNPSPHINCCIKVYNRLLVLELTLVYSHFLLGEFSTILVAYANTSQH